MDMLNILSHIVWARNMQVLGRYLGGPGATEVLRNSPINGYYRVAMGSIKGMHYIAKPQGSSK